MFDQQRGLNDRTFWQRSFRSRSIAEEWKFGVATRYIHRNPVKRGLCARPEDWQWSSSWMNEAGLYGYEDGLVLQKFLGPERLTSTRGRVEV